MTVRRRTAEHPAGRPAVAPHRKAPIGAAPPFSAVIFELTAVVADSGARPRLRPEAVDLVRRLRAGRVPTGLVVTGAADETELPESAQLESTNSVSYSDLATRRAYAPVRSGER